MRSQDCLRCDRFRKMKGRGLCPSCYEMVRLEGALEDWKPERPRYGQDMIDELDFVTMTWDRLEDVFGRDRSRLANTLYKHDRADLVGDVHAITYGSREPRRGMTRT